MKKNKVNLCEQWDTIKETNTHMGVQERGEKERGGKHVKFDERCKKALNLHV